MKFRDFLDRITEIPQRILHYLIVKMFLSFNLELGRTSLFSESKRLTMTLTCH